MSRPSRTGSSCMVSTESSPADPSNCWLGWAGGKRLLFLGLLAVQPGAHRLEMPGHALDAVLTAHTGANLGHGPKPCRCDGLVALFTRPVFAATKALESLGEAVGTLDQEAAGGEVHLAVFIDLDDVDFIGQLRVTHPAHHVHGQERAPHVAEPLHRPAQFRLQSLLDLVHVSSPS